MMFGATRSDCIMATTKVMCGCAHPSTDDALSAAASTTGFEDTGDIAGDIAALELWSRRVEAALQTDDMTAAHEAASKAEKLHDSALRWLRLRLQAQAQAGSGEPSAGNALAP